MSESNHNKDQSTTDTPYLQRSSLLKRGILGVAIVMIPVSVAMVYFGEGKTSKPSIEPADIKPVNVKSDAKQDGAKTALDKIDTELSKKSVGTWEKEEEGKRILTVKDDGTATLVYYPKGLNSYFLAKKVTIQIEWTIEKGNLNFRSISGLPKTSFDIITAKHGREKIRKIVEMTKEYFILLDEKENEKSQWTRVVKTR